MDFHARHLVLAARVGDAKRLALSLAAEALARAASEGQDSPKIGELIAEARAKCSDMQFPEALGFILTAEAFAACVVGNWRRALRLAEHAERYLSEECSGVAWERATSIQLRTTGSFHLGEWATAAGDAELSPGAVVEEAKARGDVYAMVASIPAATVRFLVSDEPLLGRQFIHDTIAALPGNRFLVPNVWAFNLEVYIALYTGDGEGAWSLVESRWPALSASFFLRVEYLAIIVLDVRARAAVAAATNDRHARLVKEALRCARTLARKRSRWAHAVSVLIQAEVASIRRQWDLVLELLERAEFAFQAVEMAHCVAACRYRRGTLIGGEKGRALLSAAHEWASSQGVVNPVRTFDMLAPGRWER